MFKELENNILLLLIIGSILTILGIYGLSLGWNTLMPEQKGFVVGWLVGGQIVYSFIFILVRRDLPLLINKRMES